MGSNLRGHLEQEGAILLLSCTCHDGWSCVVNVHIMLAYKYYILLVYMIYKGYRGGLFKHFYSNKCVCV